jgi:hypothetical protein
MDDLSEDELFTELANDFPGYSELHDEKGITLTKLDGEKLSPKVVVLENWEQGIYHVGILWPYPRWGIEGLVQGLDDKVSNLRKQIEIKQGSRDSDEVYTHEECTFSGTVFLYTNSFERSSYNRQDARNLFEQFGYSLRVRDRQYRNQIQPSNQWDVFISYDSSDSKFAELLNRELFLRRVHAWFDKGVLDPGDSLGEEIDGGLSRSDHAVLVISENFMDNVGWVYDEWQGIRAIHNSENYNVIIPIWFDVTTSQVRDFSPFLSQIYATRASSAEDAGRVADEIKEVVTD